MRKLIMKEVQWNSILTIFLTILLLLPAELFAQDNGINCFVYHRFGNDRYPTTNIDTNIFEQQLKYLKTHNYDVITFGEAVERLQSKDTLKEKVAVITIDDGYSTVYDHGWPLLQKYGYPATLFITTGQVDYRNQLSWEQIREMQDAGIEVGMHSHSHAYFLDHPPEKRLELFEEDLEESKAAFREHLGTVPEIYAYPFGEYSIGMQAILKKHGVKAAAAQHSGVMGQNSNLMALPRFPMNGIYGTLASFKEKIKMAPMPVFQVEPESPMTIGRQIPSLTVQLDTSRIAVNRINCFWYGTQNCQVTNMGNGRIMVSTDQQLQGRRGKMTLTAPLKDGGKWSWYSHPWFKGEQ